LDIITFYLLLLKGSPFRVSQLTRSASDQSYAPVNTLGKTLGKEGFSNVTSGMDNGTNKCGISSLGDSLENDFNTTLQQARLHEILCLFTIRLNDILLIGNIFANNRSLYSGQLECQHLVFLRMGHKQDTESRGITNLLNDGYQVAD
jgi:hypothetical protein